MYGVTCTLEYNDDYPALYNDPEFTEYVAKTLKEADLEFGVEICEPQPPSEDFAYYAKERPSAFIYTGAAVKMVKFTHIIILNLTFQKNHYLFRQKL